jgi:hypothetical protein
LRFLLFTSRLASVFFCCISCSSHLKKIKIKIKMKSLLTTIILVQKGHARSGSIR